jgi:hypothetical protein
MNDIRREMQGIGRQSLRVSNWLAAFCHGVFIILLPTETSVDMLENYLGISYSVSNLPREHRWAITGNSLNVN